jgi:hypothetical protein
MSTIVQSVSYTGGEIQFHENWNGRIILKWILRNMGTDC